jgi:hypothetical protein
LIEIGSLVLQKKIFFKFSVFLLFGYDLPLENGIPLYESPSPKDGLCQVWLKLAQWFWRKS